MTKKLKIQFVKFEKAIAAQLLEVDGFTGLKMTQLIFVFIRAAKIYCVGVLE